MSIEPVTALEVTYGAALPPTNFSRHTQVGSGAADDSAAAASQVDLARGGAGAYLWTARSGDEPVTAVAVLYGEEPLPDASGGGGGTWRRVARDVCGGGAGGAGAVFLAYRVGGGDAVSPGAPTAPAAAAVAVAGVSSEALATLGGGGGSGGPLVALRILAGEAEAAAAAAAGSWTVLTRPLSQGGGSGALYLALRFGAKLGLDAGEAAPDELLQDIRSLLAAGAVDFSIFWRRLSHWVAAQDATDSSVRDLFLDRAAIDAWLARFAQLHPPESRGLASRRMLGANPKYVLRNHLGELAIRAAQQKDFSVIADLLKVLQSPFDEHSQYEAYAGFPPDWASGIAISCSS